MSARRPRVSAVVPAWNGAADLGPCLGALLEQSVELEIVVWDNGSADGSAEVAEGILLARGRVLRSPANVGFAAGCNAGIAATEGDYVMLVNQDVRLAPLYADILARALEERPEAGAVQGALLLPDGRTVDSLGQELSFVRACRERGRGTPFPGAAGVRTSFSVCAAAAMYRRSALERVALPEGPFDEELFAYWEDLDLGWRLRRAGFTCLVATEAVAIHARGGTAGPASPGPGGGRMLARLDPERRRRVLANRWRVVLRNESLPGLLLHAPGFLAWEMALVAFVALRDPQVALRHLASLPATIARGWARRREPPPRPRRPTVAVAITKLELGGAQQVALAVAAATAAQGVRTLFVTGSEGLLRPACEEIPGLVRYFLDDLVREVRPGADLRAFRAMVAIFRREAPELVHTHSSKAGILGRLAAWWAGVPRIVHTVHGFGFNDGQRWPVRAAFILAERLAARVTDRFVVVSRRNVARGVEAAVLDERRAVLIRAGVDLARFEEVPLDRERARERLGIPPAVPVVGSVACLKPQKAPEDFVAVAAAIHRELPDARFVMVGDGELRPRVEALAREAGLSERLHLLGWRDDVPEVMRSFDLLLHTSLWEGLPMVLPQARASGLPIVATDVDGNVEAVEDGVHGRLCAPRDVAGMARACRELLLDESARAVIVGRTRRGLDEFSEDAMIRKHLELYGELLGRPDLPASALVRTAELEPLSGGRRR